jgi:DNA-binding protein
MDTGFSFSQEKEKRMHVHVLQVMVRLNSGLNQIIVLARNYHYNSKQLKEITSLVEVHHDELISAWKQQFSS